jgi:hypothetical protein
MGNPSVVILGPSRISFRRVGDPEVGQAHRIAENFDIFDFELAPEETAAIDAVDRGVRGGPDPELVDTNLFPYKVEN